MTTTEADGASEEAEVEEAFEEIGIGGIYDVFDADDPTDAIRQLGLYIREAEEALPGGFMPGEGSPYYGMSLADRIRSLEAENERLQGALRGILEHIDNPHPMKNRQEKANELLRAARQALDREEG